jgi:hypothetical protein
VAASSQAQVLIDEHTRLGDEAMSNDDPETAYKHYQDALVLLRAHPELTEGHDARGRHGRARRGGAHGGRRPAEPAAPEPVQQASAQQQQVEEAAADRTAHAQRPAPQEREPGLPRGNYAEAEAALDEVLTSEPDNQDASNLLRIAQRARHEAKSKATAESYRNEWQDTFDELEHELVPQNDLVVFPDKKDWDRIQQRGQQGPGPRRGRQRAHRPGRQRPPGQAHPGALPGRAARPGPRAPERRDRA